MAVVEPLDTERYNHMIRRIAAWLARDLVAEAYCAGYVNGYRQAQSEEQPEQPVTAATAAYIEVCWN